VSRSLTRLLALLVAAVTALSAGQALACAVSTAGPADYGPFSPQAVKQAAVPAQTSPAGLKCQTPAVLLLSNNYIRGKLHSDNNLKLVNGTNSIAYTASADPAGSSKFTQDGTVDYMQNNLLDLLGLLGQNADLPLSIKPTGVTLPNAAVPNPLLPSGVPPPPGISPARITMPWNYYVCTLNIAGVCGGLRQGTNVTTVLDIKLTVSAKSVVLTTSTGTTWDPVNGTSNPKSLPGGKRRLVVNVTNPDLVPVDANTLGLNLAVPPGTAVALDGDGTASTAFLQFNDGSPSSALAITYLSPSSTGDDVDFSSDRGASWAYVPVLGNDASQARVTNIRLRPRGAMAAGSQFSLSVSLKTN
jgi:hypothetical protein